MTRFKNMVPGLFLVLWLTGCGTTQPMPPKWAFATYTVSEKGLDPAAVHMWEDSSRSLGAATRGQLIRMMSGEESGSPTKSERMLTVMLNFIGSQGWELVAVERDDAKEVTRYYFRRRTE